MIELASARPKLTARQEGIAATTADSRQERASRAASVLLDLGEGTSVLAGEVVAIQKAWGDVGWHGTFRRVGEPRATVTLRGGQVLPAYRRAEEIRDDWERSLQATPAPGIAAA